MPNMDRRALLVGSGALAMAGMARAQGLAYDLIVKGGTVVDPSQTLNAIRDVGIKNGVVKAVQAGLNPADAVQVYDATARLSQGALRIPRTIAATKSLGASA
jgi:dihydroorotase